MNLRAASAVEVIWPFRITCGTGYVEQCDIEYLESLPA